MNGFTKNRLEYETLRAKALKEQLPYKQVKLEDLRYVERTSNGNNIISVQGRELVASDGVIANLDKLSGLSHRQKKVVFDAGGSDGLRDFRNYLSSATAKSAPNGYVLYMDPKSRRLERILPVIGSVISLEAFFTLAEMFMERYDLQPEAFEFTSKWNGSITLRMGTHIPDVKALKEGEEFELSGYYLRWNGNLVELGLYAMRLVCSNGQTITLGRSSGYRITSLDAKEVDCLMKVPTQKGLIQNSFDQFGRKAKLAMATPASLGELRSVNDMLRHFRIPDEECDRIAPFKTDLESYKQKGFKNIDARSAVSSVNAWDLYNRLTAFATHTDFWGPNDLSRDILRRNAAAFLTKPRDIKSYANIFK